MTSAEGYPCDVIDPAFLSFTTPSVSGEPEECFNADDWLLHTEVSGNDGTFNYEAGAAPDLAFDLPNLEQQDAVSFHLENAWAAQNIPDIQTDAPKSTPQCVTKSGKQTRKRKDDRKFRRQAIPAATKAVLTTCLERNPYPSQSEYEKLVRQHGLPLNTIKNWFSNARARKDPNRRGAVHCTRVLITRAGLEQELTFRPQAVAPSSPTPSNTSLERYLATSSHDEPASPEAIRANIEASNQEHSLVQNLGSELPFQSRLTTPQYQCFYPSSCTYTSEHVWECKQHMEKVHGQEDNRSENTGLENPIGINIDNVAPLVVAPNRVESQTKPPEYRVPLRLRSHGTNAISNFDSVRMGNLDKYTAPLDPLAGGTTTFEALSYPGWDVASSASSMSSKSFNSINSRGSRRGRRRWARRESSSDFDWDANPEPLLLQSAVSTEPQKPEPLLQQLAASTSPREPETPLQQQCVASIKSQKPKPLLQQSAVSIKLQKSKPHRRKESAASSKPQEPKPRLQQSIEVKNRYRGHHKYPDRYRVSRPAGPSNSAADKDDKECPPLLLNSPDIMGEKRYLVTKMPTAIQSSDVAVVHPFHCTFPGCGKAFTQRYEWVRHEESIHYPQKVWVCCRITDPKRNFIPLTQSLMQAIISWQDADQILIQLFGMFFSQCLSKTEAERTFFRKDHLVQHIKTSHINLNRPNGMESSVVMSAMVQKALPELWETPHVHVSKQAAGLVCSACDLDLETWDERKRHFTAHFREGIFIWTRPNFALRREALFVPPLASLPGQNSSYLRRKYQCPTCRRTFQTYAMALSQHKECRGWSCGFIKGPEGAFISVPYESGYLDWCKLCDEFSEFSEADSIMTEAKMEHYQSHKLGHCHLPVYPDIGHFSTHLKTHPGVNRYHTWDENELKDWMGEAVKSSLTIRK